MHQFPLVFIRRHYTRPHRCHTAKLEESGRVGHAKNTQETDRTVSTQQPCVCSCRDQVFCPFGSVWNLNTTASLKQNQW